MNRSISHHRMLALILTWIAVVHAKSLSIWFDWETVRFFVQPRPNRFRWIEPWFGSWIDLTDYGIHVASLTLRPLMTFSFQIEALVYDDRAWGYHLLNILVHLFCAGLLYKLALKSGLNSLSAVPAVLFFGCHPLATQPLWILGDRAEQFVLLGGLISLLLYRSEKLQHRWLAAGGFVMALLSKETAITIPLWIAAYDFFCHSSPNLKARFRWFLKYQFHYWILAVLYLFYRTAALGGLGGYRSVERFQPGHIGSVISQNTAWLLTLPHPFPWLGWIAAALTIALFVLPVPRVARFAVIWTVVFFGPVHNLCNKWYLYTPLAAAALIFGAIFHLLQDRYSGRKRLFLHISLGCIVVLSWQSYAELSHQERIAEFPRKIASAVNIILPRIATGSELRFILDPELSQIPLKGHQHDPSVFIVKSSKTPIESIVWDLNAAQFFEDGTVIWTRSVEAALRLMYHDIQLRAVPGENPQGKTNNTTVIRLIYNPKTLEVIPAGGEI